MSSSVVPGRPVDEVHTMDKSTAYFRSKAVVTDTDTWYHLFATNEEVIGQTEGKFEGSRVCKFCLTPAVSKTKT